MRPMLLGLFFLLTLACVTFSSALPGVIPPTQIRTPDTGGSQPGTWVQQGTKKRIDVTDLKSKAQQLQKLATGVPSQVDKIGNGVLPTDLIENLKKIEKLAKQIRGDLT